MDRDIMIANLPVRVSRAILVMFLLLLALPQAVSAESSVPQSDQTPLLPLFQPNPLIASPRYLSGFGMDNVYTIFYEDRADTSGCAFGSRIHFNQTSSGPLGFAATSTATNICDTHLIVKDWAINIAGTNYAYRAWGAVGNNPSHAFYVSNDLINWTQVGGFFTFPDPFGDQILYGFHDIVRINNNYMGFAESAGGHTYIVWSDNGDQTWSVIARVGGSGAGDHLILPDSPTPTGNFVLMEVDGEQVYGKLYVPGDDSGAYLIINPAAAQAGSPALAEAAFLDPANWTWSDGSSGAIPDASTVLSSTLGSGGHDVREAWTVPTSEARADHVILYTATYASSPGRGIGCAAADPECLVVLPAAEVETAVLLPATGFAPGQVTSLTAQDRDHRYAASAIQLTIPRLGVSVPVVGVPLVAGEWDTSWLNRQAGWLEGTAYPTWLGNSAVAAHVYDAYGQPGPFVNLNRLAYNDEVRLVAWGEMYIYHVRENRLVLPGDVTVLEEDSYAWLTLVTCQGYQPDSGEYRYRRVVRAVLVEVRPVR